MSPSVWHLYGRLLGDPPQDAWKFRTLHEHGARLTVGTDWVVTPTPNLLPTLEGMLDRGDESTDLSVALRALTLNMLYCNLFDIPTGDISKVCVLRTVFEGQIVFNIDESR